MTMLILKIPEITFPTLRNNPATPVKKYYGTFNIPSLAKLR